MSEQDVNAKKYSRSMTYLFLGAVIIFAAVLFINQFDAILPNVTDEDSINWFIGAAVAAIIGWVILFIGIIGVVRNNSKNS